MKPSFSAPVPPPPRSYIDDVNQLLLDTSHPLPERQSRLVTLGLLRELFYELSRLQGMISEMGTGAGDLKKDIDAAWNRIREYPSPDEVAEALRTFREYPSIPWLLKYRRKDTVITLVGSVVVIIILFLTYQEWLLNRLGLPPLILP